ncbi:hypothetical protein MASR2M74_26980 [Paracoccaceae bacterium]
MSDTDAPIQTRIDPAALAAQAVDRGTWIAALEAMTAEEGYVEPLGPDHYAFFTDAGTSLLVTFETIDAARGRPGQMPLGQPLALAHGWSHLSLLAEGETWFRDPAVYAFFDRLVDDAFFEDFDRVLFYGAGMGAHAACAFAVTAPGAQVLAIGPCATLNPAQAGWDKRHRAARRLDFTSRYGYAPEMTEGAGHVAVIHDPNLAEDAMHAALFRAPWVTVLKAPLLGGRIESAFSHMGILRELIPLAMAGQLGVESYAGLWRRRRSFGPYLQTLLDRAEGKGRRGLAIAICRSVTQRLRAPRFARRLEKLLRKSEGGSDGSNETA